MGLAARQRVILAATAMGLVFALTAWLVHAGKTLSFDQQVLRIIHEHSFAALDWLASRCTNFGDPWFVGVFSTIIVLGLFRNRQRTQALTITMLIGGSLLLNAILKNWFDRARPTSWHGPIQETGFSFPSGHAMASMALATVIVYLSWHSKHRSLLYIATALYLLVIGWSRLYLGVHYPSDVIGGWLVVGAYATVVLAVRQNNSRHSKARP